MKSSQFSTERLRRGKKMENDNLKNKKLIFIEGEILTSSILGGLSRGNPVYQENINERARSDFKNFLREKLKQYGEEYCKNKVDSEQHIENIIKFTDEATKKYGEILAENIFKIGRAQKLLNLYLKYLWALDLIKEEPPHCPFDSRIISEIGENIAWTSIKDINIYRELVKKSAEVAKRKKLSLAKWELELWNRINNN